MGLNGVLYKEELFRGTLFWLTSTYFPRLIVNCTDPVCAGLTAPEMVTFLPSFTVVRETFSVTPTFTSTVLESLVEALSLDA